MLQILGFILVFFLPVIESFNRILGFSLLLTGSLLISFPVIKERKLQLDKIELLFLIVLLIFAVTTLQSWSPTLSFLEFLRYLAYFLIFISVRRLENISQFFHKFLIPMVVANSLLLSLLALSYWLPMLKLTPPNPNWGPFYGMNLFYPTYGHNRLSDLLIFTLPILSVYSTLAHKKYSRIVLSLGTLFFIIVFFLTLSRGAMLSVIFAFFVYIFVINKGNWQRWYLYAAALLAGTLLFFSISFLPSNFPVLGGSNLSLPRGVLKPASSEKRAGYLLQAWKGFSLSPVLGTGLDTFRNISFKYPINLYGWNWWTWYAHNQFVQIFTETGFLGGILFLALIIILLFRAFQNIHHPSSIIHNPYHGLFIAILASIIHSLIDFDWQFLSVFLIFWMAAAILVSRNKEKIEIKANNLWLGFYILTIILFFSGIYMANKIVWIGS